MRGAACPNRGGTALALFSLAVLPDVLYAVVVESPMHLHL